MDRVLVLDIHVKDPPFAGPRWIPEGIPREVFRVLRDQWPASADGWSHLVISGSALSITEDPAFLPDLDRLLRDCIDRGVPAFGVCYGAQIVPRILLGMDHVRKSPVGVEVGWLPVEVVGDGGGWFEGLPDPFHTWQYHYDEVHDLPDGWRRLARSDRCEVQAWDCPELRLFGTQFHPEMDLEEGNRYFREEAEKIAAEGISADALIADGRDDGARMLFERFLRWTW
jgi:GMP synthase (glutamine-hydrolysing)